jgi:transcriptional regulator PpsR
MTKASGSRPPLGGIDASTVTLLVETASDLALVLDDEGIIVDLVGREDDLARHGRAEWLGRPWIQTVTAESRDKVTALLQDAASVTGPTRWRQVNHPVPDGDDVPIVYSAVGLGPAGARKTGPRRFVAVGRDLRATVALQRKLIEAQQAMERDYWRFREAETRYRNLLQTSTEAILVVELQTLKIVEANPAAELLCAGLRQRLVGAALGVLFDAGGQGALQAQLAAARTIGKRDPGRFTLADGTPVMLSLSSFRQDEAGFLLARLLPVAAPAARGKAGKGATAAVLPQAPDSDALVRAFVGLAPDGIAFTDLQGRVLSVNRTFATLAELSTEDQARGQVLDRWLGRTGVELQVLIGNLRQRGSAGLFTTTLRGEFGATTEVEIAATVLPPGQGDALAFSVRDVARRLQTNTDPRGTEVRLPRTVGELNELVGRVPLKDIVSETTEVIEQMAIQTALRMTGDNRASAAQLLGLSRQSLYVKLRRFGIGELADDDTAPDAAPG